MGPGAGVDFVYKEEVQALDAEYRDAIRAGTDAIAAQAALDAGRSRLTAEYERELMNPKEALSLGSVSSLVMPGESRRVLAKNLDFLMRTYQPCPMGGVQREHD